MRKRIHASATDSQKPIFSVATEVKIEAAAADGKAGPRKFDVTAYTGGKLIVAGYDLPIVVDLKGLSYKKRINANLDHKKDQRVGQVTEKHNDGKSLRVQGLANAASKARDEVIGSADDGFDWGASIEALPTKTVKVPAGKSAEVNGQSFDGPIYIARKAVLGGFAFLTGEADENTHVTIAASAASTKELDMEFAKWIEAAGFTTEEYEELTDKQKSGMKAKYDAEIKAAAKAGGEPVIDAPEFDAEEIQAAAADHRASLEAIFAQHEDEVKKDKFAEIRAEASKTAKELKVKALKEKWATPKYEAMLIRAAADAEVKLVRAERPKGPAIHSSNRDISGSVIEAALCQTVGLPDVDKQYDDKTMQAAHTAFKGRVGLQQMIILAACNNGLQMGMGEKLHDGNLRAALRHAFMPIEATFSTVSLPGIFSNVANKELLAGYMEGDQSWKEISQVKNASDFKAITSYRLLDDMEYEEVAKDGEIKHGTVSEESMSRQVRTYAKMFALTRVDIINDDLSAFDDLRTRLARGSIKKFNNLFWTNFMANSGFFTAGRGNYITGSTTNLAVDGVGLELAVTAFRHLKSSTADGAKRVGGRPSILLVPPELEFIADRLYSSGNVNAGGAATSTFIPSNNIHANKYRPVVVDWLSDPDFSGYSTTAYYLARAATEMAAMVVSFLNGNQSPTVESAEVDFAHLGIQFRGYHDFGCDLAEYLAAIKVKGAA